MPSAPREVALKAYRVMQWHEMHESAESRKLAQPWWYCKPNKADGISYSRMTLEPDALALYGAWGAIMDAASKGPRETRGWLIRNGRALDAEDLALMSRFPKAGLQRGLDFFCTPEMGWLVQEEFLVTELLPGLPPGAPGGRPGLPAGPAAPAALPPATAPATPPLQGGREGGKQTGKEGSGEEGERRPPTGARPASSRNPGQDLKVMFAALKDQIQQMERRKEELTPTERDELRKKKRRLELIQDAQAKGKTEVPAE